MSDLIYRDEAIKTITSHNGVVDKSVAKRLLLQMKSAQPRKKGKWIEKSTNGEMFSSCSVCGYIEWDVPRKFCPNCGCQMNGGEDDEID